MSNQSPRQQTNEITWDCKINLKDGFRVAEDWIRTGNYTPKEFAKYLPHTAKDLSQGRRECDNVSSSLESCCVWVINPDKTTRLRHLSWLLAHVIVPESLSQLWLRLFSIQLGRMIYLKLYTNGRAGTVIKMHESLSEVIQGIWSFLTSEKGIEEMARELDQSFGAYRRDSPVFTLTESEFVDAVLVHMEDVDIGELWRECEEMRRTANGFFRVIWNFHSTFSKCWTCSNVFEKVFHCSRCKAAVYCSRECQVASWRAGHKARCGRLEMAHELYVRSMEDLEKVHLTGVIDGFELCAWTDVVLVNSAMTYIMTGHDLDPLERSMKTFYENLGRIIRGEWWVYDMSDQTGSTRGATDDTPDFRDTLTFTISAKFKILFALTKDWFGGARKTIGTDDPQKVTAWADPCFRETCGPPVSAEALLAFYVSPLSSPSRSWRVDYTIACYDALRKMHAFGM